MLLRLSEQHYGHAGLFTECTVNQASGISSFCGETMMPLLSA